MAANATRTLRGSLVSSATAWWMVRLGYYEMITTRGYILYPRNVVWQDVYANEFIPEMRLLGHNWKDFTPRRFIQLDDKDASTSGVCHVLGALRVVVASARPLSTEILGGSHGHMRVHTQMSLVLSTRERNPSERDP